MTEPGLPPVREVRAEGWICVLEADLAEELLAGGLIRTAASPPSSSSSAPTGRAPHARINLAGGTNVILRRYRHGGLLAPVTGDRFLSSDRFRSEFDVARAAWAAGVPTARPVAVGWRSSGLFTRGFIATLVIPAARDLLALFARPSAEPVRVAAARACAQAVRRMHDAGIVHADLHLKNLLVGEGSAGKPGEAAWVIDLDLARRETSPLSIGPRVSNLARLYRSVEKHRRLGLSIGDAEVEAFCEAYFGDDSEGRAAAHRAMGRARWRAGVHARRAATRRGPTGS